MSLSLRLSLLIVAGLVPSAYGADFLIGNVPTARIEQATSSLMGLASVLSGDTLWFPASGVKVRLTGIKSCALPQWAFDPSNKRGLHLAPVPCGSFAKAWLTRESNARSEQI